MIFSLETYKDLIETFAPAELGDNKMSILKQTNIVRYPFPLPLRIFTIYVFRIRLAKTITVYAAVSEDYNTGALSSFEVFEAMLDIEELTISTPEQALAYATAVFTIAPPLPGLFYLVSEASDLPVWDEEKREEIVTRFQDVIVPPAVLSTTTEGFTITFYACDDETLRFYTIEVSPKGHMAHKNEVIAEKLPLMHS